MSSNGLKVLSYNIHKGFALSQKFVLGGIRERIRAVQADIVFLQEVQGDHSGHQKNIKDWAGPQLEYIADSIWPHFAYGRNAVYTEGHHGNAILSKFPIKDFQNIDISNNRFERRGILHAITEWESAPLHLLCVHLDLTDNGRRLQNDRIIDRIKTTIPDNERLILAGDFNDWRGLATAHFEERLALKEVFKTTTGSHAKTFPAPFPFLTLDRMYLRGLAPLQAKCHDGNPWSQLSDHVAIEATLTGT
ncbi:endonuclease/exonuclease/phosphatase family protein [soil metagenome]